MDKKRNANKIDEHVGARVRAARNASSVSQEQLGAKLGISYQQVQKYETGANRISCSMMAIIAAALDRDVSWFFEGAPVLNGGKSKSDEIAIFFQITGAAELASHYVRLDPKRRATLRQIAVSL